MEQAPVNRPAATSRLADTFLMGRLDRIALAQQYDPRSVARDLPRQKEDNSRHDQAGSRPHQTRPAATGLTRASPPSQPTGGKW